MNHGEFCSCAGCGLAGLRERGEISEEEYMRLLNDLFAPGGARFYADRRRAASPNKRKDQD